MSWLKNAGSHFNKNPSKFNSSGHCSNIRNTSLKWLIFIKNQLIHKSYHFFLLSKNSTSSFVLNTRHPSDAIWLSALSRSVDPSIASFHLQSPSQRINHCFCCFFPSFHAFTLSINWITTSYFYIYFARLSEILIENIRSWCFIRAVRKSDPDSGSWKHLIYFYSDSEFFRSKTPNGPAFHLNRVRQNLGLLKIVFL